MDLQNLSEYLPGFMTANPALSILGAVLLALCSGTGIFAYLRSPGESSRREVRRYFTESKLLSPPTKRPAYSDRMAYILAEMSDLAYFRFESTENFLEEAVKSAVRMDLTSEAEVRRFLESYTENLRGNRNVSIGFLCDELSKSGFELLDVINIAETQGFVCRYVSLKDEPYVVIAFRGTEQKISDWLTDADALPTRDGDTKVHTGFLKAFTVRTDNENRTVEDRIRQILDRPETRDEDGNPLLLFITGHSLGGALALMAMRLVAPDVRGACYTYGAPRIANYEYFRDVRTPVYRIVNSSDVVPRIPPGAGMLVILSLVRSLSWLTGLLPAVSSLFDRLEDLLDKLNGYRHFGDMRYLSDVREGRFEEVRLLTNPPAIDRMLWFGRHLGASLRLPVKQHSMSLYRKKLTQIAHRRNRIAG